MSQTLVYPPLSNLHKKAGAKCVSFANHYLPLWFSDMKTEHLAVRNRAGIFDISHMGVFALTGPHAASLLRRLSCNDIDRAAQNTMIYAMFLNDSGMILDDVMLGKHHDTWYLVVNGSNRNKIQNWIASHNTEHVPITLLNTAHSFLALQGPQAVRTFTRLFSLDLSQLPRFGMITVPINNIPTVILRTGYTGEDGLELIVDNRIVEQVWAACIADGVQPCGLAARDSLRIEYGLPLYGQELSESIHPHMTRYPWILKSEAPFIGKHALATLKESTALKAVGLTLDSSLIARPNYPIQEGGHITSGTLSPITGASIALAFVPTQLAEHGTCVTVQIRKHMVSAVVCKVPFL